MKYLPEGYFLPFLIFNQYSPKLKQDGKVFKTGLRLDCRSATDLRW